MKKSKRSRSLIYILIAAMLFVGFGGVVVDVNSARLIPYHAQIVSAETSVMQQTIDIPVMVLTEEEADERIEQIRTERKKAEEEAARKRREQQKKKAAAATPANARYSPSYFKRAGRIWWGGWSWTYYSERILPGYGLRIPGRHTDSMGYVRDGNGYLCLASDVHRKGTVLDTPFGSRGKVYDCGCGNNYTVDVYVNW